MGRTTTDGLTQRFKLHSVIPQKQGQKYEILFCKNNKEPFYEFGKGSTQSTSAMGRTQSSVMDGY